MCDLPLCRVLLVDDASYPCWLVLVPRLNHVREVTQLGAGQQAQLWREVAAAARVVERLHRPFKMNLAAIGNIVSQLHVHVTGRLQVGHAWGWTLGGGGGAGITWKGGQRLHWNWVGSL